MEETIPVKLNGMDLFWLKDRYGNGALAYAHHVDEGGDIKLEHAFSESYGHVLAGEILRHGQKIGTVGDLELVARPDTD